MIVVNKGFCRDLKLESPVFQRLDDLCLAFEGNNNVVGEVGGDEEYRAVLAGLVPIVTALG
jgi:hypothetical protein